MLNTDTYSSSRGGSSTLRLYESTQPLDNGFLGLTSLLTQTGTDSVTRSDLNTSSIDQDQTSDGQGVYLVGSSTETVTLSGSDSYTLVELANAYTTFTPQELVLQSYTLAGQSDYTTSDSLVTTKSWENLQTDGDAFEYGSETITRAEQQAFGLSFSLSQALGADLSLHTISEQVHGYGNDSYAFTHSGIKTDLSFTAFAGALASFVTSPLWQQPATVLGYLQGTSMPGVTSGSAQLTGTDSFTLDEATAPSGGTETFTRADQDTYNTTTPSGTASGTDSFTVTQQQALTPGGYDYNASTQGGTAELTWSWPYLDSGSATLGWPGQPGGKPGADGGSSAGLAFGRLLAGMANISVGGTPEVDSAAVTLALGTAQTSQYALLGILGDGGMFSLGVDQAQLGRNLLQRVQQAWDTMSGQLRAGLSQRFSSAARWQQIDVLPPNLGPTLPRTLLQTLGDLVDWVAKSPLGQMAAGVADAVTNGWSLRARVALGVNDVDPRSPNYLLGGVLGMVLVYTNPVARAVYIAGGIGNAAESWQAGNVKGFISSLVDIGFALTGTSSPCTQVSSAAAMAQRLLQGAMAGGLLVSAYGKFKDGDFWGGLADTGMAVLNIVLATGACFARGTPFLTPTGTRRWRSWCRAMRCWRGRRRIPRGRWRSSRSRRSLRLPDHASPQPRHRRAAGLRGS